MTIETIAPLDYQEAQRLTERIRLSLDTASRALDRLAAQVAEAYERRADLALGYGSWAEYAEAEFAEQTRNLAAPIRRELVGYLSASGMSTRAIAPATGSTRETVRRDVTQLGSPVPEVAPAERIDPDTGEVLTNYNTGEIIAPTSPRDTTGLDGKTYPRPEPKEHKEATMTTAPTRLAIPQPPRYGGNRLKHKQIIANAITAGNGMRIALDEIADKGLDGSITTEEADQYTADLSEILRSLKRIQSLLKKEV